jgi:hypothetical protein
MGAIGTPNRAMDNAMQTALANLVLSAPLAQSNVTLLFGALRHRPAGGGGV